MSFICLEGYLSPKAPIGAIHVDGPAGGGGWWSLERLLYSGLATMRRRAQKRGVEEQAKAGQDIRDAGGVGTPHTPHSIHRDSGPLLDYQGR